jgi:hypothetical protein
VSRPCPACSLLDRAFHGDAPQAFQQRYSSPSPHEHSSALHTPALSTSNTSCSPVNHCYPPSSLPPSPRRHSRHPSIILILRSVIRPKRAPRRALYRQMPLGLPYSLLSLQELVFGGWLVDHVGHPCVPTKSQWWLEGGRGGERESGVPAGLYLRGVVFFVVVIYPSCPYCLPVSSSHTDATIVANTYAAAPRLSSHSTCCRTCLLLRRCLAWYHLYKSQPCCSCSMVPNGLSRTHILHLVPKW